jgi:hypothetical protein
LVSVYRRALPTANVAFLDPGGAGPGVSNIMWDAREPTLENQFIDATDFHGQSEFSNEALATQGANFQLGLFTAQTLDFLAGDLTGGDGSGATGGPQNLFLSALNVTQSSPPGTPIPGDCFFPEVLDGQDNVCPGIFGIPNVFNQYTSFASPNAGTLPSEIGQRESIARGETIFNTRPFTLITFPDSTTCRPHAAAIQLLRTHVLARHVPPVITLRMWATTISRARNARVALWITP